MGVAPSTFQVVYFVSKRLHEFFLGVTVYCIVLCFSQDAFSSKILEDGVHLFVELVVWKRCIRVALTNQLYDFKALLYFQVFLLTFF